MHAVLGSLIGNIAVTMSGGWNPLTGRDALGAGHRPPFSPAGASAPGPGQAYIPHIGGPGYTFGTTTVAPELYPGYSYYASYSSPWLNMAYTYPVTTSAAPAGYAYVLQPNGAGVPLARAPQPYPSVDPQMPAAQMTNSSGGVGCEPGYNFFFPSETTKAHVFYSETPPWQLPANAVVSFKATHIPCNTLCSELLAGFGCDNPAPKKNKCVEIVPGGNGKWYKGIQFCGGDKDMMKKTIRELGWDKSRTGNADEKPVVCLWFCKN